MLDDPASAPHQRRRLYPDETAEHQRQRTRNRGQDNDGAPAQPTPDDRSRLPEESGEKPNTKWASDDHAAELHEKQAGESESTNELPAARDETLPKCQR